MPKEPAVVGQRLFAQDKYRTHMPFFDGTQLLFCRAAEPVAMNFRCGGSIWKTMTANPRLQERFASLPRSSLVRCRAWKIHLQMSGSNSVRRIATGLPDNAVECSPAFFSDAGSLRVSFIGGIPGPDRIDYRLYQMTGPSWDELTTATPVLSFPTSVGFVSPSYVCFHSGHNLVLRDRRTSSVTRMSTPFLRLLRASYRHDAPEQILATGLLATREAVTLLFDTKRGTTQEVRADGPLYKPSIYGDTAYYARRLDSSVDAYYIWRGPYSLKPTGLALARVTSSPRPIPSK